MKKILIKFLPEISIFLFALFTRFSRLDYPSGHMFDEVYHAFTAQEMFKNNLAAWEWWNTPPQGFAFEWTHPPLAKEFMTFAIFVFGDSSFAWRFFSSFFGVLSIALIYLITLKLFKSRIAALIAAFAASLEGLILVMSRIAMNDSYLLFFSLLAIFLYLNNRKFLMAISLGLAISSKWTGVFVILAILIFELYKLTQNKFKDKFDQVKNFLFLFSIPLIVYLISYIPFFLGSHTPPGTSFNNFESFIELQRQMFFYHKNLIATHPYQSIPLDWIFNSRPVWIFVEYKENLISSIYTLGNPVFVFGGLFSILILTYQYIKRRNFAILLLLISYFLFFLPWIFSPRIMFNYHYLLSTAFLAIAQGVVIAYLFRSKYGRFLGLVYLLAMVAFFIYFYPLWIGLQIDKNLYDSYFWLNSWK